MPKRYLFCRNFKLALSNGALVMGVLNITPNSFFDGGKYFSHEAAYKRAIEIQAQGADIIDIGGESTRPGAKEISIEEETNRIIPVIKRFAKSAKIPVSVDTRKPEVAKEALRAGASIVNDITGLLHDRLMADIVASYNAAVIIMHIKGTPRIMQNAPRYGDLIAEINSKLKKGIDLAIKAGIRKDSIVVDPGIGFGKTVNHNFRILSNIDKFKKLGFPVLIGLSRKSFIGKILNLDVKDRLIPTTACNAIAINCGASIIRVHDIEEAVWTRRIAYEIINS